MLRRRTRTTIRAPHRGAATAAALADPALSGLATASSDLLPGATGARRTATSTAMLSLVPAPDRMLRPRTVEERALHIRAMARAASHRTTARRRR